MSVVRNPWTRLSIVLFLALLARMSLGASSNQSVVGGNAPGHTASANREVVRSNASFSEGMQVYGGPGMFVQSGATGFEVAGGLMYPMGGGFPLYLTAEVGVDFLSFGSNSEPSAMSAVGIPLLVGALYRFEPSGRVRPYFGLLTGANVHFLSMGVADSRTRLYFEMLFRAGVGIKLADRLTLNLEPRLGLIGSNSTFVGQASVVFDL